MKLRFKLFIKERLEFTWCLQDCPWYIDNEDFQPGCDFRLIAQSKEE